ncbi:hypothetical protein PSI07_21805 [Pseudoalteromonas sp. GABNS16A]|uniref:hypothetical protein n=1 Tax=Pseudoalteromonas sp. GABNS16A TaxID=3025321 RepID=UPI0023583C89|nr:hypothetical protein [Pseudoalteromonas sp. GABNS16A]MDC9575670.1 hypothetical protein [Pseudoalteromonas sp. GABNS16A]
MITEGANRGHSGNSCAGLGVLSAVSISESSSDFSFGTSVPFVEKERLSGQIECPGKGTKLQVAQGWCKKTYGCSYI